MYEELLRRAFADVGVPFEEATYKRFMQYMSLLQEWNQKMNLTAITEDEEVVKKHFIDSMKIFKVPEVASARTVIDVGTGAGFPGVPMAIADPTKEVTLMDSLNKRLLFLQEVGDQLGITGQLQFVHARAEEAGSDPDHRQRYDVAVSRAVANMTLLAEYCLPFVRVGGVFVAMKGPNVMDELKSAELAIETLGGHIREIIEVDIEDSDLKHNLVVVEKVRPTDRKYPRHPSIIKKKPL